MNIIISIVQHWIYSGIWEDVEKVYWEFNAEQSI